MINEGIITARFDHAVPFRSLYLKNSIYEIYNTFRSLYIKNSINEIYNTFKSLYIKNSINEIYNTFRGLYIKNSINEIYNTFRSLYIRPIIDEIYNTFNYFFVPYLFLWNGSLDQIIQVCQLRGVSRQWNVLNWSKLHGVSLRHEDPEDTPKMLSLKPTYYSRRVSCYEVQRRVLL